MKNGQQKAVYFGAEMIREIQAEAERQDRTVSSLVRMAWLIARGQIKQFKRKGEAHADKP